jgi:hypothetical protein
MEARVVDHVPLILKSSARHSIEYSVTGQKRKSKMADRLAELEVQFSLDPNDKETWDHTAVNIYRPDFEFPKEYAKYLPESTQYVLKELDYLIPHNEALGLIKEAQVQRYSMARKLNDPHSRGFHGGDPERLSRTSLSDSPIEDRGRRYASADQYFESSPNVYRAALPESPLMTRKYANRFGDKTGFAGARYTSGHIPSFDDEGKISTEALYASSEGRNRFGDGPQTTRYGSDFQGYYRAPYSEDIRKEYPLLDFPPEFLGLQRDASPEVEQHEAIHRGMQSVNPYETQELAHDYIRDVQSERTDMSDYDFLLEALRSNIFKSEE